MKSRLSSDEKEKCRKFHSEKLTKKAEQEVEDLFISAANDNERVQWLSERLLKEIQEEYENQIELVTLQASLEKATEEHEALKEKIAHEREARHKLEGMSQDLLQENKQIIENRQAVAEEEKKRFQKLFQYFQTAIAEISQKLEYTRQERRAHENRNKSLKEEMRKLTEEVEEMKKLTVEVEEITAELKATKIELEAPPTEEETKSREELEEYRRMFEEFRNSPLGPRHNLVEFKKSMDSKSMAFKRLHTANLYFKKKVINSQLAIENLRKEREDLDRRIAAANRALQELDEIKANLSG